MKQRKDERARTVRIDLLEGQPVEGVAQPHRDPCRMTMRIILTTEVIKD